MQKEEIQALDTGYGLISDAGSLLIKATCEEHLQHSVFIFAGQVVAHIRQRDLYALLPELVPLLAVFGFSLTLKLRLIFSFPDHARYELFLLYLGKVSFLNIAFLILARTLILVSSAIVHAIFVFILALLQLCPPRLILIVIFPIICWIVRLLLLNFLGLGLGRICHLLSLHSFKLLFGIHELLQDGLTLLIFSHLLVLFLLFHKTDLLGLLSFPSL